MPKTKAGALQPVIHQMKKDLEEKKDLSADQRRSLVHRLKRTQRKACKIKVEENRIEATAKAKAAEEPAPSEAKGTKAEETPAVATPSDAEGSAEEAPAGDADAEKEPKPEDGG